MLCPRNVVDIVMLVWKKLGYPCLDRLVVYVCDTQKGSCFVLISWCQDVRYLVDILLVV